MVLFLYVAQLAQKQKDTVIIFSKQHYFAP